MATVLGINGVFHDSAAALVVDGEIVAAAEEERFNRRKHGKVPVPFSTWELPELSARWCLEEAGVAAADLDAIAYSYDPALAQAPGPDLTVDEWEGLRTLYAQRSPLFLRTVFPDVDTERFRFVAHHVAHAASAYLAAPFPSSAVMTLDGRGNAARSWPATWSTVSSRCSPTIACPTRWACSTRSSPPTSATGAVATSTR